MNIEKLQKQKQAIEAQIAKAEFAAKNKPRVEKLVLGLLQKHPDIFLCDLTAIKNNLDKVLANIAENPKNHTQLSGTVIKVSMTIPLNKEQSAHI